MYTNRRWYKRNTQAIKLIASIYSFHKNLKSENTLDSCSDNKLHNSYLLLFFLGNKIANVEIN